MAIFTLKAPKSFQRGTVARTRDNTLDPKQHGLSAQVLSNTATDAQVLPFDIAYAPAVRAFLADRQEGLHLRQMALARAVMMARQVC